MTKSKILITGASGMLGSNMATYFNPYFDVFATGNSDIDFLGDVRYKKFDLSNDDFSSLIEWSNPDIIVHCAALTNGNYCEENPLDAFNINGVSVKKFLDSTSPNVKMIYISTDAVFPSDLHLANEKDHVNPQSIYGKSKELGEYYLTNSNRDYLIVRTTIVGLNLNRKKSSFAEWIIESSINHEVINLFDDVTFTPISIWHLLDEIKFLIEGDKVSSEILHISGSETCTKYEFGISLLKKLGLPFSRVKRGSIQEFKKRAKRSMDQSFAVDYYENKFNRKLPAIREVIEQINDKYKGNEQS